MTASNVYKGQRPASWRRRNGAKSSGKYLRYRRSREVRVHGRLARVNKSGERLAGECTDKTSEREREGRWRRWREERLLLRWIGTRASRTRVSTYESPEGTVSAVRSNGDFICRAVQRGSAISRRRLSFLLCSTLRSLVIVVPSARWKSISADPSPASRCFLSPSPAFVTHLIRRYEPCYRYTYVCMCNRAHTYVCICMYTVSGERWCVINWSRRNFEYNRTKSNARFKVYMYGVCRKFGIVAKFIEVDSL